MSGRLSVTIITKNEAHNIVDCLRSVAFADELIVLDSGSTDDTLELARQNGAKCFVRADWEGFGIQKNRALELATGDWVLSLDADERVTPELAKEIRAQILSGSRNCAYDMPRRTYFCGEWIKYCGWSPDRVLRLAPRTMVHFSNDSVHETLQTVGALSRMRLRHPLLHYSYIGAIDYFKKLQSYSLLWANERHAAGQTATIGRAFISAAFAFFRSYFLRLGVLDGKMGFVVCQMQAQAAFGKYFALYDLGRSNRLHVKV